VEGNNMKFNIMGRQFNIKGIVALPLFITIIGVVGYLISSSNQGDVIIGNQNNKTASDNTINVSTSIEAVKAADTKVEEEIKVYVTGCVYMPGIVTLKKGQLIDDAISAAGGATKDADLANINLVYKLSENVMIYIKSKKENQVFNQSGTKSSGQDKAGTGVIIKNDSSGAVKNSSISETEKGKVNINTAGMEELCTIPWVGESIAKDIIEFREKNGPFKKTEDIMKIPGIKQNKYNKMKDSITV
jgi:competence protein ComEA